jgi:hypothetical protein
MERHLKRVGTRWVNRLGKAIANSTRHAEAGRVIYSAISELDRRYGYREHSLSASELRVFSQNGEDGVLSEIFARIGDGQQFFVEFGTEDGLESNTRFLRQVRGWNGVYFESDPTSYRSLLAKIGDQDRVRAVQAAVTPENVEQLFEEAGVPEDLDLLSIDIDGQDYYVWQAIERFRPRVVLIEYNSGLPAGQRLVEPRNKGPWDQTNFFGASIDALIALAATKGYRFVHAEMAGVNAFFVAEEHAGPFDGVEPLRRTPNYWWLGLGHPTDPLGRPFDQV